CLAHGQPEGRQEPRGAQGAAVGRPRGEPADPHLLRPVPARQSRGGRGGGGDRQGAARTGAEIRAPSVRKGAEGRAMRTVAGKFGGREIAAPKGRATRPTSDKARQAVFNILEHAPWAPPLDGARVIDLFAGAGALGFEALSRGASFCLFVETDAAARGAIR